MRLLALIIKQRKVLRELLNLAARRDPRLLLELTMLRLEVRWVRHQAVRLQTVHFQHLTKTPLAQRRGFLLL